MARKAATASVERARGRGRRPARCRARRPARRGGPLDAHLDAQALGEEREHLVGVASRLERRGGRLDQPPQVQPQTVFTDDADDAQRGTAQRVGVARAGRLLAANEKLIDG